jgi:hypothetical protein
MKFNGQSEGIREYLRTARPLCFHYTFELLMSVETYLILKCFNTYLCLFTPDEGHGITS